MKILVLISCFRTGLGGHYRSCVRISEVYSNLNGHHDELHICTLGLTQSAVIKASPLCQHYINLANRITDCLRELVTLIHRYEFDIIHAYDIFSLFFGKIAALITNVGLIYTKAGGSNPTRLHSPYRSPVTICFSKENYDYFKMRSAVSRSMVLFLPQQDSKKYYNGISIYETRRKLHLNMRDFVVMRVARLNDQYVRSILCNLEHIEPLFNVFDTLRFVVIGSIESRGAFLKLQTRCCSINKRHRNPVIRLMTHSDYTVNAWKLWAACNIAISTGRGTIETFFWGIPSFIPIRDGEPILLCAQTFGLLSYHNFSGRVKTTEHQRLHHFFFSRQLPLLIKESDYYNELRYQYSDTFQKYFDISNVVNDYGTLYHADRHRLERNLGTVLNLIIHLVHVRNGMMRLVMNRS